MDGHRQRQALSAAERALQKLAAGDRGGAKVAAAKAETLDQVGAFAGLEAAVGAAAAEVETRGGLSESTREALSAAVGPGPLAALVERLP